jgi:hypothetical protein
MGVVPDFADCEIVEEPDEVLPVDFDLSLDESHICFVACLDLIEPPRIVEFHHLAVFA